MARQRIEDIEIRQWSGTAKRIPVKFHPRALIPSQLTLGDEGAWEYVCEGGETVRLELRGVFDNSRGQSAQELERWTQELYGMSFAAIEAVWARRIGRLDGWWQIVHLIRLDTKEGV